MLDFIVWVFVKIQNSLVIQNSEVRNVQFTEAICYKNNIYYVTHPIEFWGAPYIHVFSNILSKMFEHAQFMDYKKKD